MYKWLRKLLFLVDPETIHDILVIFLRIPLVSRLLGFVYGYRHPALERELFGIRFRNPVGLAAGFDKNAGLVNPFNDLGFGFIEIGTVTPKAQPGNPRPRIFRLPADSALINRMGFNNEGVAIAAGRLKERRGDMVVAGNIGKNKITPNEAAAADYLTCFEALYELVDFFVVNVSSPNTPNLRKLQEKAPLTALLKKLQERNRSKGVSRPILLKIAPDLTDSQLDDIIEIVRETGLAGIIATNTTISREGLVTSRGRVSAIGEGGLSGKPLRQRATEVIRYIHKKSGGSIPIIGVGGIHSPQDALEKLRAGASLVEIYTGFIYEGPALVKKINQRLVREQG